MIVLACTGDPGVRAENAIGCHNCIMKPQTWRRVRDSSDEAKCLGSGATSPCLSATSGFSLLPIRTQRLEPRLDSRQALSKGNLLSPALSIKVHVKVAPAHDAMPKSWKLFGGRNGHASLPNFSHSFCAMKLMFTITKLTECRWPLERLYIGPAIHENHGAWQRAPCQDTFASSSLDSATPNSSHHDPTKASVMTWTRAGYVNFVLSIAL